MSQFGMNSGNSAEMSENAVRVVPNPTDLLRDFVLLRTGAQVSVVTPLYFPNNVPSLMTFVPARDTRCS